MRGHPLVLLEDRNVFLPVDRNRDRLTEVPVALRLFRGPPAPDHRIEPVEAQVPESRLNGFREFELALAIKARLSGIVLHGNEVA